jgi:hypothetical protein
MLARLRTAVRELGRAGVVLYGASRLLHRARMHRFAGVYHYDLMVQPVLTAPLLPVGLGRTIDVRRVLPGDPALSRMPVPASVIDRRFAQPTECLGAFRDDELVAYLWICFGPYEEDEVRCRFVPFPSGSAAWDFDVFVFPAHRLGVAFARLWDETHAYLRDRGITHTFSRVARANLGSQRAHARLRARPVGTAAFVRIGPCQWMVSTERPHVHLSLRAASRPVLRLDLP